MGVGKQYNLPEIDETRASGREEAFEEIIEKVKAAGGEIVSDEVSPSYTEMGTDYAELGEQRVVEFNLNSFDFKLTRKVEDKRVAYEGNKKMIEQLDQPRIAIDLKKKGEMEDVWETVDLDALL